MRKIFSLAAAAGALVLAGAPALAASPSELEPQRIGNVEYISGGAGEEQRAGMREMSGSYNLKIATALESGSYVSDAQLTVVDVGSGETVLSTQAQGPLFYANVPEGRYRVTAAAAGQARTREVRVGSGSAPEVTFRFRAPGAVTQAAAAPARRAVAPARRTPVPQPTQVAQGSNPQPTRAEAQGHISLYSLDPMAAERAKAQVEVYQVFPDGTRRPVDPAAVRAQPEPVAPAETDAVIINIEPATPGTAIPPLE